MARGNRGGYRKPSSPAAVSGPGAGSRRTDGGPGDKNLGRGLGYGENKAINDLQSSAPMQSQGGGGGAPPRQGGGGRPPMGPNGIFGPSERPGEPITSGVDAGPGAGAPITPRFDDDVNYMVRAIAAENPHLADYLLGLADA